MGANQSTGDNPESSRAKSQHAKTCYYELLGVERQASEEEYADIALGSTELVLMEPIESRKRTGRRL